MTTAPIPELPRSLVHLQQTDALDSLEQAKRVAYEKGCMACKAGQPRDSNPMTPGLYTPQEHASWDLGWTQTTQAIDEARRMAYHAGKLARRAGVAYTQNPHKPRETNEDVHWNTGWLEEDASLRNQPPGDT